MPHALDAFPPAVTAALGIALVSIVILWIAFPLLVVLGLNKIHRTLEEIRDGTRPAPDKEIHGTFPIAPSPQPTRTPAELYGRAPSKTVRGING